MIPLSSNLTVIIAKKAYEKLKKHFRSKFPIENCAILLGKKIKNRYYIREVYIPENQVDCSQTHIQIKDEFYAEARKYANTLKLKVLGDVHSHCFKSKVNDGSPSEADWRGVWYMKDVCNIKNPIFAILKIDKNKGRYRYKITFWNSTPPIETHFI